MPLEINSEWIEDALLEEELATIELQYKNRGQTRPARSDLMLLVKENIIRKTLLRQEAKTHDFEISTKELENAFKLWQEETGIEPSNLEEKQKVEEYLKNSIQVSMLLKEVVKDINPITSKHEEAYYRDNLQYYNQLSFFHCVEVFHENDANVLTWANAGLRKLFGEIYARTMAGKNSHNSHHSQNSGVQAFMGDAEKREGNLKLPAHESSPFAFSFAKLENMLKKFLTELGSEINTTSSQPPLFSEGSNTGGTSETNRSGKKGVVTLPKDVLLANLGWYSAQGFSLLFESDTKRHEGGKALIGTVRQYSNGFAFYVLLQTALGNELSFSNLQQVVHSNLKTDVEDGKIDLYVKKLMEKGKVVDHREI